MANFLLGLAIVIGGWWIVRSYANSQPAQVRALTRKIAGGGLIAISGFLALRGALNVAMPLFALGIGLFGQNMVFPNGMPWARPKSPGQNSRVATSMLAMELDHDSGAMAGEVLAGTFKGRRLATLSLDETRRLHAECARAQDQSRQLLEAWIERTHPEWREQWGGERGSPTSERPGVMGKAEALAVLGLKAGATPDDIRAAHRRLMKAAHPDLGGSDYLAAKINAAKETLLGA